MKRFVLPAIAVCAFGTVANADVLWDQSNFDAGINALVDQEFGDFPTYSSYMVMDVMTDAGGWMLDSVTTYYTFGSGFWSNAINTGRLSIFEKTGGLPGAGDDPSASASVPVTLTLAGDHWEVTASGLGMMLDGNKEYWIGLTPIADFGVYGQEFHLAAPIVGVDTAWRNPGGSFGFGDQWQNVAGIDSGGMWVGNYDAAFLLEGYVVPAPGALALLGLAGLVGRRRR